MKQLILLTTVLLCVPLHAAQLVLDLGAGRRTWETEALLAHPKAQTITVDDDVAYQRQMTYRAVPMAALLDGIKANDHLQAVALDGFAAELSACPLLDETGARAWLAVEAPTKAWPPLAPGKPGAGPFYLVWTHPRAGHIGPEQWPFQVASIQRLAPVAERFPALLPDPKLAANDPLHQGFALFQKNCLACHKLNGAGDAQVGPDLNVPYSPTEYFTEGFLKRYIRDPKSLRHWPQARMPAFSATVLPDGELDLLVKYLQHMAKRKVAID